MQADIDTLNAQVTADNNALAGQSFSQQAQQQQTAQSQADVLIQALQGLPPSLQSTLLSLGQSILKNPNVSPDEALMQIQASPAFQSYFPGIKQAIANGYPPPSVSDYLQYIQTANSLARAAGFPEGFVNPQEIGNLIGNNVSLTELEERINNGFVVANQADPATKAYLEQNFGVKGGDLASFYLNPDASIKTLEQETNASQIAGAGENAGFAPISVSRAMQLAQLGVSQQAAVSGFKQIGQLLPLTTPNGMQKGGPGVVTQDQLVGSQFVGDAASSRAVQLAEETRKAGTSGGGGFATQGHTTSVGSGSQTGIGQ